MRPSKLLILTMMAGLLAFQCEPQQTTNTSARSAPQRCVGGTTRGSNQFSLVHGCITYNDGSQIRAVDPDHPSNRISLRPSRGLMWMTWSRDGSRLLVIEGTDSGVAHEDLYVVKADDTEIRLTSDGGSTGGSFSPDGKSVAFTRANEGLYVVDAEGGTPQLIAKSYRAWWLESPAWSPDGSRIAYMVYLEGGPFGLTYEIWTVNADGTNPRQLVDLGDCGGGGCSGGLTWSPDGSMLAFQSMRDSLTTRTVAIYVVHADGSGLRRINSDGRQPSWSPDGSRLAFVRFPKDQGIGEPWGGELFTISPDGSNLTLLVEGVGVVRQVTGFTPRPSGLAWNPVG
jgi:Tol biopolymer transport system component